MNAIAEPLLPAPTCAEPPPLVDAAAETVTSETDGFVSVDLPLFTVAATLLGLAATIIGLETARDVVGVTATACTAAIGRVNATSGIGSAGTGVGSVVGVGDGSGGALGSTIAGLATGSGFDGIVFTSFWTANSTVFVAMFPAASVAEIISVAGPFGNTVVSN